MKSNRINPKAVASLILGILGITILPVIGAFGALVLARVAIKEIDQHPGMDGVGLAIAGRVLGRTGLILGLCVALFAMVWAVAYPASTASLFVPFV